MAGVVLCATLTADIEDSGVYSISGTITEQSEPGSYRVRLHDQATGRPLRETWSDANGAYSFTNLDQNPKYIIAFDHTAPVQTAIIQDSVIPS